MYGETGFWQAGLEGAGEPLGRKRRRGPFPSTEWLPKAIDKKVPGVTQDITVSTPHLYPLPSREEGNN